MMFGGILLIILVGCLIASVATFLLAILFHQRRRIRKFLLVFSGICMFPALILILAFWWGSRPPDSQPWVGTYRPACDEDFSLFLKEDMTCSLLVAEDTLKGTWRIEEADGEWLVIQCNRVRITVSGTPQNAHAASLPAALFGAAECDLALQTFAQ